MAALGSELQCLFVAGQRQPQAGCERISACYAARMRMNIGTLLTSVNPRPR